MPRPPTDPVAASLRDLGVDADLAEALHAQVARALEGGARPAKRKGAGLNRARNLGSQPPASGLDPLHLVPLVHAVRDVLKRGERGGRTSRARQDRLERAADVAVRGLVESASRRSGTMLSRRSGGRDARTAHQLLERFIAVTPDAVFTLRASGAIGMWSVAASRLTGQRRWEVHRRGAGAIFRDKTTLDTVLAELDVRGRLAGREAVLLGPGGDDVSVRIFGARLKEPPEDAKGKDATDPERYLIVLHDLSELQHIRLRLIETEKLSAMAKIAGSVAHEFRNPLNSLFLSTDLLEDELEGHDEVQSSIAPTLAAIREEIERLNQIITHYLSLSRVAGAEPEVVDLRDVVSGFATDSTDRLDAQGVELLVRADEGDCRITADPNQLRRILVNLVENAVDALTADAEGDEAVKRPRRARITLLLRRMRRSVKLTVKDNGPGIPDDIRERVFEPFFTSKAGGAGLGLYLVREIALASDGTMSLSSRAGRGTSVSIRWPYANTEGE